MSKLEKQLQLIINQMNDIEYGFADESENIYPDDEKNWDNNFQSKYFLQSPETLIKTKYGVCWDQVELERYYLEANNIKCNSYFIVNYDGKIFPTHTFVIVNDETNYYWLEHSWEPYRGIHKYKSLNDVLLCIKNNFNHMIKNKYNISNNDTIIYEYKKPNYNIKAQEFFKHCESGNKVKLECDYKLENATINDIERIKKYKLDTIFEYAKYLDKDEVEKINNYVNKTISTQILEYKNIVLNNIVVGSFLITKNENDLLLDEIFIEKQYRNKGIGGLVLNDIISNITENIYLWVYKDNIKAIKLYKKLGFSIKEKTNSRYYMEYFK